MRESEFARRVAFLGGGVGRGFFVLFCFFVPLPLGLAIYTQYGVGLTLGGWKGGRGV